MAVTGKIIVDIWGGERHCDHVARFVRLFGDAVKLAHDALEDGYLVNLRLELAWGDYTEFDHRKTKKC